VQRIRVVVVMVVVSMLSSCVDDGEGGEEGGSSSGAMEEVVDERVAIPADTPSVLNFVSGEFVVPPGEDRMMCTSVGHQGGDVAYRNALMLQGRGGHHAVLLGAREPLPAGTIEDCSNGSDMTKYEVVMIPRELPPGHGSKLPAGRNMVIQSHYVNTTSQPILVRDVVQLELIPMDDVRTWAAPLMHGTLDLEIPAGQRGEVSFDCVLEQDVELLVLGGHMHEWGTTFRTEIGPTIDALELLYVVDPWKAEFRDVPPVTLFLEQPKPLAAGTIVRTTCAWENTESHALVFPHEMCITFGIVAGLQDPVECRIGE
jgi:hypothetical protein